MMRILLSSLIVAMAWTQVSSGQTEDKPAFERQKAQIDPPGSPQALRQAMARKRARMLREMKENLKDPSQIDLVVDKRDEDRSEGEQAKHTRIQRVYAFATIASVLGILTLAIITPFHQYSPAVRVLATNDKVRQMMNDPNVADYRDNAAQMNRADRKAKIGPAVRHLMQDPDVAKIGSQYHLGETYLRHAIGETLMSK